MKCKKCRHEGKFKFCPECGAEYKATTEDRLDMIEKILEQLVNTTKEEKPSFVPTTYESRNVKFKPVDWITRIGDMFEYVKQNPREHFTLSGLHKAAIGYKPSASQLKVISNLIDKGRVDMAGVQVITIGNRKCIKVKSDKASKIIDDTPMTSKKKRKKQLIVNWNRRFGEVIRYAKKHPEKKWTLSGIYNILFGTTPSGDTYTMFKEFAKKGYAGAKIDMKGNRLYISSKHRKKKAREPTELDIKRKEVGNRAWDLIREGMDKSDAWKQAHNEIDIGKYMIRNKPKLPKSLDEYKKSLLYTSQNKFPEFECLDDDKTKILNNVLKNVIHNKGELGYIDALTIGIDGSKEYSKLINELLMKLDSVCKYFKVKNNFRLEGTKRGMVLRYNG